MNESDLDLAAVVHDLRIPLTGIIARAQLTRRNLNRGAEATSVSVERALSQIQALAHQMTTMLEDVLATSHPIASESATRETTVTNLAAVLSSAADQVEQAMGQTRIRLEVPGRSVAGRWDRGRIARALVNVLENALKYSPQGGPVVVRVRQVGPAVVVTVQDEGIGIPAADLPRVFESYVRGTSTGDRFAGTGIGLASARRLIESQGGSIAVASVEGVGTTVTITLASSEETRQEDDLVLEPRPRVGHGD